MMPMGKKRLDKNTKYNKKRAKKRSKKMKSNEQDEIDSLKRQLHHLEEEAAKTAAADRIKQGHKESGRKILEKYRSTDTNATTTSQTNSPAMNPPPLDNSNGVLSKAKAKIMLFIAQLPEVKTGEHVAQVIEYIATQELDDDSATNTAIVDAALVDCLSELLCAMKPDNTTGKGSLTKWETIIKEMVLSIAAKATIAEGVKKIDVTRRIDPNMKRDTRKRFNKAIPPRIQRCNNLMTNTTSTLADITARTTRKDKIDIALCVVWWHEEGSRVDTNGRQPIWVYTKDTGKLERHVRHYFTETIPAGYKLFKNWQPYKDYLKLGLKVQAKDCGTRHSNPHFISENMFSKGICKCIRRADFRSCVDMNKTQMQKILEAHHELTKNTSMKKLRKNCKCAACKGGIHKRLNKGLTELRHLCLCKKEPFAPYGVPGRLDPPLLYGKDCCIRGDDFDKGGEKCHHPCPTVCKAYHRKGKKDDLVVPLCKHCGIERMPICPHMITTQIGVDVQLYQEVTRENKHLNDELVAVRKNGKELMQLLVDFAPCYFSHYWLLKHDDAVEEANSHRMDDTSFEDDGVTTIVIAADYASVMEIPTHDMKVCTYHNTANLEMFCVRFQRREVNIPLYKKVAEHSKVVWTNDIWHFWRPSDGTKGNTT